jgi:GntR family transcriptional regulator, hexuronate regulon transcriptional repressor
MGFAVAALKLKTPNAESADPMTTKPVKARLYEQLAEKLARAIADGVYAPGDRLPAERELATTFEVSRPTIREAIIALELDGLVEVKVGSGVYVRARRERASIAPVAADIGAFELTEARILFEGEVAALAATQIGDAQIDELDRLLEQMALENARDGHGGEDVDLRFHMTIAEATQNSAMSGVVEYLWTIRNRSPQCVRTFEKSRSKGYKPVVAEHRAIVEALRARDPDAARAAMRAHLSRVLDYLLDATEVEAIEETRRQMQAQRERFRRGARV